MQILSARTRDHPRRRTVALHRGRPSGPCSAGQQRPEVTGPTEPDLVIFFGCGLVSPVSYLGVHSAAIFQMIPGRCAGRRSKLAPPAPARRSIKPSTGGISPPRSSPVTGRSPTKSSPLRTACVCGPLSTSAPAFPANAPARGRSTRRRRVRTGISRAPSRSSRPPAWSISRKWPTAPTPAAFRAPMPNSERPAAPVDDLSGANFYNGELRAASGLLRSQDEI